MPLHTTSSCTVLGRGQKVIDGVTRTYYDAKLCASKDTDPLKAKIWLRPLFLPPFIKSSHISVIGQWHWWADDEAGEARPPQHKGDIEIIATAPPIQLPHHQPQDIIYISGTIHKVPRRGPYKWFVFVEVRRNPSWIVACNMKAFPREVENEFDTRLGHTVQLKGQFHSTGLNTDGETPLIYFTPEYVQLVGEGEVKDTFHPSIRPPFQLNRTIREPSTPKRPQRAGNKETTSADNVIEVAQEPDGISP
ncbi:hypothetical protein FRC04_008438 [Tulasnella sp. 424]|nr:hypothetical protein FRC04_008438 [Tulasnella sp. 424]KAG8959077.1 hypothetical protein FRC05_008149 [Tulasnella sp. 425]